MTHYLITMQDGWGTNDRWYIQSDKPKEEVNSDFYEAYTAWLHGLDDDGVWDSVARRMQRKGYDPKKADELFELITYTEPDFG